LVQKKEASELFGVERQEGNVAGIVGNVFQSFGGADLYPTVEEKAAHLLYFMVKNIRLPTAINARGRTRLCGFCARQIFLIFPA